jgi:hypothetical protein
MTTDAAERLLSIVGSFGVGAIAAGALTFYMLRSFLPSYFSEKAKNLATREDIATITNEIERIKAQHANQIQAVIHQYNLLLEAKKGQNLLRLAALERRLQAHQDAFELWRKLLSAAHGPDTGNVVMECQEWWNKNCLYLEAEARNAFNMAYHSAHMHEGLKQDPSNLSLVTDNWTKIMAAGDIIVKSVDLPPIAEREADIIRDR